MNFNNNEKIIRKERANHLLPSEGVGGKLFLTDQRLFFKSHMFNYQNHEESIPLEDIIAVITRHSDFISKKLEIYLSNGLKEYFIVNHRKDWVHEIEKTIADKEKTSGKKWYQENKERIIESEVPSRLSFINIFKIMLITFFTIIFIYFLLSF